MKHSLSTHKYRVFKIFQSDIVTNTQGLALIACHCNLSSLSDVVLPIHTRSLTTNVLLTNCRLAAYSHSLTHNECVTADELPPSCLFTLAYSQRMCCCWRIAAYSSLTTLLSDTLFGNDLVNRDFMSDSGKEKWSWFVDIWRFLVVSGEWKRSII